MTLFPVFLALALAVVPVNGSTVSVAYAGSLVHVMEGPLAQAFERDEHVHVAGEGKGSNALAHLIAAGLRTPDIFISADTKLLDDLRSGTAPHINGYTVFGSARMVLAYSPKSKFAPLFAKIAGRKGPLLAVLANPDVKVGRTDPALDPKGARTEKTVGLLGKYEHAPLLATSVLAKAGMFPEEDLAVRVESGELDAGFFYSTEIPGRGLIAVELPAAANLSHEITYGAAVLNAAPNRAGARAFVHYILSGSGRPILQAAGIQYFAKPETAGRP